MGKWPTHVTIKEVGPRDGLQNEKTQIATEDKIAWINKLSKTGLTYIEITSFVHPKWIPQLSDALEVATRIERVPGVTYAALVPNQKGLEKALTAQVDEVAVFMSASETHNRKNINKSIEETFPVLEEVVRAAKQEGKTVRGYVSTVFGCPYEGSVSVEQVIRVSERLFDMGIDELSLGDTIGVATPKQVQELLEIVLKRFPKEKLAMHFHDTRGTALANILISLEMGITTFDSSLGGLGGCPYAPGASGNVATDDLVYMLHGMGIATGIDVQRLMEAALFIQEKIGRPLSSRYLQTIST
ncbi:hydroxymethylglutaryl-CoA lyase [Saccharococcus thermophilus]|uniref:Hydroxymethylglutaryl-CoA lyase n=1 Tax=Saccharococcus thermophilus TaxID=29396 RepID=A0A846MHZ4_9BACL|nr:hydroxymethylglutaryl-CoA lyase [Saccharococcus thermophilus]NIK14784.1 hydroxymethylglutaryl-CoA lyase [Saccharococcus thermophilus]